jgi:4-amino-4-deoxy-L-arabinose transferase-like glycosyltransferase
MTRKDFALLYIISVLVIAAAGYLQKSAGYMDAEYYAVTGKALVSGRGFTQDFLWNYLDDPASLPHPSNTYWMPMATILSTGSISLQLGSQKSTLWVLQILFSALIPVITAWIAFSFTARRSDGWMAGLLGLFPGFYLLYYAVPETFTPEMVFGALLIILLARMLAAKREKFRLLTWAGIGALCGLLHMTRAEGLIWLLIVLGCLVFLGFRTRNLKYLLTTFLVVIFGYAIVSGAWYVRNVILWGQLFPPGTSRTLWLSNYDQTFLFPPDSLSLKNWINLGTGPIMRVRLDALWMNIKSAIAVQGGILLVPFIIAGCWLRKKDNRLILAGIYYATIFLLMTLVFPFAGMRGGFIHAAAGVQIFFWAVVPVGLDRFVHWGEQKRNWQLEQARRVFQVGIVAIMIFLTGLIFYQRVLSMTSGTSNWLVDENQYNLIQAKLIQTGNLNINNVVMVKNPPGWNLVAGTPAIVIPDGGLDAVKSVAAKFGAKILIIDKDHPQGLELFFSGLEGNPDFELIFNMDDLKVFRFTSEP